ncbi:hypothetical protein G7Y89_g13185 [Cudoniella acicularis]|uniref:AAA+ ATPase domain-containing protein n=1 Tax=Cudoniella acicularis TaxID=354080 RepID=A0A8H4VWN7_9HELO|nr:hypothetical protein G7Y89_g13185 [Cudoniella acicularis]
MRSFRRSTRTSTIAQTQKSKAAACSDAFAALDDDIHNNEGKKCEIHMYERRFNSRGEAILLQSGRRSDLGWIIESSIEAALVLTRYYSIRKELEITQLEIKSPYIRAALKDVVGSYPGVNITSNGPIFIIGDPMCLFHYREDLHIYASKVRDKKAKEHVTFLLQYMAKVLSREVISYDELMQNEDFPPGLEFQNLWMGFKPGALLYHKDGGIDSLCRLKDITKMKPYQLPEYWRLCTEMIANDGKDFKFTLKNLNISTYDGYRPFTQLEIFPLEYHQDHKEIRTTLLERGKKYITLLGIHHYMYDGLATLQGWFGRGGKQLMVRERIIIDSKAYIDDIGDTTLEFIPDSKVIRSDLDEHLTMSDEELLICKFQVHGFTLTTKRWGIFNISHLRPVEYHTDAFASLVLPDDLKKTLSSLVHSQEGSASQFDDFITGKGKGLIILLHGPPGVGKTFTAESIADYSRRPLYTLGKGDFGNSLASNPDESLSATLARASRWGSVVLLDEADVFMQERSASGMFRNEQVSVLLRILEYFEGIMILTTNRVQTIDAAFKSRIHLSLTYPPLDAKARSGLWETFILKSTKQQRPRWLDVKFLKKISKEDVNGREIKNIVRVAHALAVKDKRLVRPKDILQGLQYLKDFERDFSKAASKKRAVDGEEAALAKKIRLDNREAYNEEEHGKSKWAEQDVSHDDS